MQEASVPESPFAVQIGATWQCFNVWVLVLLDIYDLPYCSRASLTIGIAGLVF